MTTKTKCIRSRWKYTGVILGLVGVTWLLTQLAKQRPDKVEQLYSSAIYPQIVKIIGIVVGKVPFSIAEVVVFGIIIGITIGLIGLLAKPKSFGTIFHVVIRSISIAYMVFYLIWGFNYYREDYIDLAGMSKETATIQDLALLSDEIIVKMNDLREDLQENEAGVFEIQEDFHQLAEIAKLGFQGYEVGQVNLSGIYAPAKPLLISKAMSHTGITGIYFPYTGEANVNIDVPHTSLLTTICHEMGHQMGFAKEEEANFIAYKASINNPDIRFQYAGYYLALQHLLSDIYKADDQLYMALSSKISDGVKRDMNDEYDYWKIREGKAEKVATTLNDNYLKANNQTQGVKSYDGVVKLLLAEYKSR